jgi:hypothetical protein
MFVAANGVRGMRLAARFGEGWITLGRSANDGESCLNVVREQIVKLDESLVAAGRSRLHYEKVLLHGFSEERPLESLDAFVDWAGHYRAIGITELVVHWPEPNSLFDADMDVFEHIATQALSQLEGDGL